MQTIIMICLVVFVGVAVLNELTRRLEAARTVGSLRAFFWLRPGEAMLVRARGTIVSGNDQLQALRLQRSRLQTELVFARHGTAAGLHECLTHNPHYEGSVAHRAVAHMASLPRPVLQDRARGYVAQPAHGKMTSRLERRLLKIETKIIRLESMMSVMGQPGIQLGTQEQLAPGPLREAVVACEDTAMMDSVRYTLRSRQGEFEPQVQAPASGLDIDLDSLNLSFGEDEEASEASAASDAAPHHPFGGIFRGGLDDLGDLEFPKSSEGVKPEQAKPEGAKPEGTKPQGEPAARPGSASSFNLDDLDDLNLD